MFLGAMALCCLGTIVAILAEGFGMLLVGRIILGIRHRDYDASAHDHRPHSR